MAHRIFIYATNVIGHAALSMALSAPALAQHRPPFSQSGPMIDAPFGSLRHDLSLDPQLTLTDAQEDQIFRIVHASAPALHERITAVRRAHEALVRIARSDAFDRDSASALAAVEAQARAEVSLLRAETMHRIREVLTVEQRAAADRRTRP